MKRTRLEAWTEQVACGALSRSELEDLLKGEADMARLEVSTAAGIALARLEQLHVGLWKARRREG
ncbi:hypothetical protein [Phenylobacterium sp.]|uniref:hypothetical protein n=1 Tax=Phenylobacterium sp. TaxID=1871053 RepID=UPI0037CA3E4C